MGEAGQRSDWHRGAGEALWDARGCVGDVPVSQMSLASQRISLRWQAMLSGAHQQPGVLDWPGNTTVAPFLSGHFSDGGVCRLVRSDPDLSVTTVRQS